jgi:outer membrane receptor protein involved in Fe transport
MWNWRDLRMPINLQIAAVLLTDNFGRQYSTHPCCLTGRQPGDLIVTDHPIAARLRPMYDSPWSNAMKRLLLQMLEGYQNGKLGCLRLIQAPGALAMAAVAPSIAGFTFRGIVRNHIAMRVFAHAALLIAAGSLFNVGNCHAQISSASINGMITDSSGAIVPDAAVVLRNTDTGVETHTTSNAQGVYIILSILPGNYTLEAGKLGFANSRLEQLALVVDQRSVFDFALAVGTTRTSVTVEANGTQLQTASAELGGVLTHQQTLDLPASRSVQNLMALTPGINAISTGQGAVPSVNGQINRSSMYMLDGVNNQATFYSALDVNPVMETVEEFKVQSHNDSAEVGGVMGGVINIVTKSGTNELHGTVYDFEQNDAFNARNTFLASVAPYKGHNFGGTAGGPVRVPKLYNGKNRTFFFAAWQTSLTHSPAESYFVVPTAANLRGDLSNWALPIYNPYTTRLNPAQAGTYVRDPFPGNIIPGSLLNPGMVYFAQTVLPQPIFTGVGNNNAINSFVNANQNHTLTSRIDQKFSDKDSLWVRYVGNYNPGTNAVSLPSQVREINGRNHNMAGNWVHTFGPTAVLQVGIARVIQWSGYNDRFSSLPSDFSTKVGYSSNVLSPYADGNVYLPNFSVAGFWSGGEQTVYQDTGDSWHFRTGFSKQLGKHTLKVGAEWNLLNWNYRQGATTIGFAPAQTADPLNLAGTGSALASYLLGTPDNATRRNVNETMPWWGGVMGFYIQDGWKVTDRLTLNLGLRYDRTFIPSNGTNADGNNMDGDINFLNGTYILQRTAPPCSQAGKAPCVPTPDGAPAGWLPANTFVSPSGKVYTDTTKNLQPRLGLAYRLGSKTVIRAGAGVFFDNYSGVTQLARNFAGTWPSIGYQSATNENYPTTTQLMPSVSYTNPLPSATLPAATPFSQSAYFADPAWQDAYSEQWNFGIERQLSSSLSVTVDYVGSESHRTDIGGRYNVAVTPGPGAWQDRSPFPNIAIPSSFDRSWGNANYNALQVALQRRWSHGVAFTLAYSKSKAIGPGSSGFFAADGQSIENPYQIKRDRSVLGFDIPQNLVMSWVYQLPFGKGNALRTGNRTVDYVIGNWQWNGVSNIRSGQPYTLTVSGDIANTGNSSYERPNVVGNWQVSSPSPQKWFNTAAFAAPAAFTFGNAGGNILRTDGVCRFDMSLFRNIPIRERFVFQLRVEAYNIFNTVTYNAPTAELTNANFGKVLSAMASRSMIIGARVNF